MHVAEQYAEDVLSGKRPAGKLIKLACERYFRDLDQAKDKGWSFDRKAADVPIKFASLLKHYKGKAAGKQVELLAHQQFQNWNIYGWKQDDGTNRFRRSYESVARKNGKALDIDTDIPTPDGWKKMRDLKIGDCVFDETGNITRIHTVSDIMYGHNCYAVKFADGSEIIADEEHLWYTELLNSGLPRIRPREQWGIRYEDKIRTTKKILETLIVRGSNGGKSELNHKIPLSKPVQTAHADLPIPPYTLGVWLGNGHSSDGRITNHVDDTGITNAITAEGFNVVRRNVKGKAATFNIEGLSAILKILGLSNNKHVPAIYLRASCEQRMELLRGLMDTDGTVSKDGQCSFTTTSQQLCSGFYELVCSLGFKTTIRNKQPKIYGDPTGCAPAFIMDFFAFNDRPVFKLKRKIARQKEFPKKETRSFFRKIVSVTPVDSRPVKCIGVDSKSHLYLAGRSFIPTHNTTGSAIRADLRVLVTEPNGAQVYCAATKENQANIMTNDAACLLISQKFFNDKVEVRQSKELISRVITKDPPYSFIRSIGRDSKTEDGRHASEIKIDEYHAWDSNYLLDVLEQSMKGRLNPLIDITTTAGLPFTGGKDGVCFAFEKMCIDVLEGNKVDDSLFIMIHRMDKIRQEIKGKPGEFEDVYLWEDESQWPYSNPALDAPGCVSMKDLRAEYVAAKNEGQGKIIEFKTKSLNIWTDAPKIWIDDETWMKSAGRPQVWDMFGIGQQILV